MKILWVEDDYYRLRGLVRPLELRGIEVVFKEDLKSSLELLKKGEKFDLFLIDIIIPEGITDSERKGRPIGENVGLEIIKAIREQYKLSTPIIVLTVIRNEHVMEQASRYDAKVLRKGICTPADLQQEILSALGI